MRYRLKFTLDYEIHGNGDGNPMDLMVNPTWRLMDLLEKYGQRVTIMADVAEILKFREYYEQTGDDKFGVVQIEEQLCDAIKRGHDVQLHIHSSYFNAVWDGKHWDQYIEEYNMAALPYQRINEMVGKCVCYLQNLLSPINPDYRCHIFRAANWSMMPTPAIYDALVNNGIDIDTSVYKGGMQVGNVNYDYTLAFDALYHYSASRLNINNFDPIGKITEYPIYCEMRPFWSFISILRIYRMLRAKFHKHKHVVTPAAAVSDNPNMYDKHKLTLKSFFTLSPWKMDFNQATSRQLCHAIDRIQNRSKYTEMDIVDIVLIGHSKTFLPYNEKTLEPFLKYISSKEEVFKY